MQRVDEVKTLAEGLRPPTASESVTTGIEDLKDLVPKELSRVRTAIAQYEKDLAVVEEMRSGLEQDLLAGVDLGTSSHAMEFQAEIRTECARLEREALEISTRRSGYQKSLDLLLQI